MKNYGWVIIITFLVVSIYLWSHSSLSVDGPTEHPWDQLLREKSLNIIFVKVHKVGGSTVAGVLRRIAWRFGLTPIQADSLNNPNPPEPALLAFHRRARQLLPLTRTMQLPSFTLTFLRDPADRALSQFYFDWRRQPNSPAVDLDRQLEYLRQIRNAQLDYIKPSWYSSPAASFATYDLVGLQERLDESMLVLMHLLNLTLADIVYLSAKVSAEADVVKDIPLLPRPSLAQEHSSVATLLRSTGWRAQNADDYLLITLASERIDRHIKLIGEQEFRLELAHYRRYLAKLNQLCRVPQSNYTNADLCGFESADCNCFELFINQHF